MLVGPMHQVGVCQRFALRTEFCGGNPHEPAFRQVALDQPERQVSPADSGEDERMLCHVVTYPPCSRRQNVKVAALCKRRWILGNDLHVVRQIRRCDRISRRSQDSERVASSDDGGARHKRERPPFNTWIGKIDTTYGHSAAALPQRMNCFSERCREYPYGDRGIFPMHFLQCSTGEIGRKLRIERDRQPKFDSRAKPASTRAHCVCLEQDGARVLSND